MSAELNARRTAAAAVLADYHAAMASAPLTKPPGREWMLRLASVLDNLLAALGTSQPDTTRRAQGKALGPFETERDAREAALKLAGPPRPGWSILSTAQNRQMLTGACGAAGVDLRAHDARILDWIAGFEDSTCVVVAGLVARAYEAGQARRAAGRRDGAR